MKFQKLKYNLIFFIPETVNLVLLKKVNDPSPTIKPLIHQGLGISIFSIILIGGRIILDK